MRKIVYILMATIFSFPLHAQDLTCSPEMKWTSNQADLFFCTIDNIKLPKTGNPRQFCQFVEQGSIGFTYDLTYENRKYFCPYPFKEVNYGGLEIFCLLENLPVSNKTNLKAYCHFLADGYIGYSWDVEP